MTQDTAKRPFAWLAPAAILLLTAAVGCSEAIGQTGDSPPADPGRVDITIVENYLPYHPALPTPTLQTEAVLIEAGGRAVLFDAGRVASSMTRSMALLGKDPRSIDAVVISHEHHDHWHGLGAILEANPNVPVYVPAPLPEAEWKMVAGGRRPPTVLRHPTTIVPGVLTTGAFYNEWATEHGLVVRTPQGPVLLQGCAHPGPAVFARRAVALAGGPLFMIAGGFDSNRNRGAQPHELERQLAAVRALNPRYVAPYHCAYDFPYQTRALNEMFAGRLLTVGHGALIRFEPGREEPIVTPAPLVNHAASPPPA